jgi:hypothetical protein
MSAGILRGFVGEGESMIHFSCHHCAQRLTVPDRQAGHDSRCPRCKQPLVVPNASVLPPDVEMEDTPGSEPSGGPSPYDHTFLDVTEPSEPAAAFENPWRPKPEYTGERPLPWPIDILLYPVSLAGLANMAIFVMVMAVMQLVALLTEPLSAALSGLGIIVSILFGIYLAWYFSECVRDSALGGVRAPQGFALESIGEMASQALYLAACYALFAMPAIIYRSFSGDTGFVFWLLVVYGVFFFPIGLLAAVMFRSSVAFNPMIWIGSIGSTFIPYCGLVLLVAALGFVLKCLPRSDVFTPLGLLLGPLVFAVWLYGAFIVAHLIGRFFYRYEERLNWEV